MHFSRLKSSSLPVILSAYFLLSFCIPTSHAWALSWDHLTKFLIRYNSLGHGIVPRKYKGPPTNNGTSYGFPLVCDGPVPDVWLGGYYGNLYAFCAINDDRTYSVGCSCKRRKNAADVLLCKGSEDLEPRGSDEKALFQLLAPNVQTYCGMHCSCPGQAKYPTNSSGSNPQPKPEPEPGNEPGYDPEYDPEYDPDFDPDFDPDYDPDYIPDYIPDYEPPIYPASDIPQPLPPNPDMICFCNETYISLACCYNSTEAGIVHEPPGYNWYDYFYAQVNTTTGG